MAHVDLDDEDLAVRFGPWAVRAPRSSMAGAEPTQVAGGPHLSFA